MDRDQGQQAQICNELQIGPKGDLGPENCFLTGLWTGPEGQNCKELQFLAQKEFWAQETKEDADRVRITRRTGSGIFVINVAQSVIYFTSVVKLGKPKTSGPIICTCISHAIHKCPQFTALACISYIRNMLGNKCYFLNRNQIINSIM